MHRSLMIGVPCVLLGAVLAACETVPSGANSGGGVPLGAGEIADPVVERSRLREEAISILIEAAASDNAMLRGNSLEALSPAVGRLRAPLAAGLVDQNPGVRAIALVVAGREGFGELAPAVRPLLQDASPLVRASALYALRAMGEEIDLTPLGSLLLETRTPGVRAHAAYLLGELGDASALPLLRQALHDDVPGASEQEMKLVWLQIAEAMVKLGDRERLEGIRAALYPATPGEYELAVLATQILGRLGDRASMTQLIKLSEHKQNGMLMPPELRLAIADAVARMGRNDGGFIAESFLTDPDALRRSQAALVLGQTAREQDLATLGGLLDDPNPLVRTAAAGSILTITAPSG